MSDTALSLKLIASLYKFYDEKQGELPLYFANDVSEFWPAYVDEIFSKEKADVDVSELDKLAKDFFSDSDIALSGLGMLYKGKLVKEYYNEPYKSDFRRVSYSVCKTIVALAFGIAMDMGVINLETRVSELCSEHNKIFMKRDMKELRIRHLLTMTAGVYFDEIKAFFSYDWKKDFMSSENIFTPGNEFYYNSLNSYMLAVCIEKATGENFMNFLTRKLLAPMNLLDITWDKCPRGHVKGGWGMKLSLLDMLKVGQLIQNKGEWVVNGRRVQLVSKQYIEEMTKPHVKIDNKRLINGYGYGVWMLKDGSVLLNGIFGQNVYINNEKQIVIATCGSAKELFPEGKLVESIMNFAKEDIITKRKGLHIKKDFNINVHKSLRKKLALLRIKDKLNPYFGITYKFDDYASSILPLMSQVMYSNFMTGINSICFNITDEDFFVKIRDDDTDFKIRLGYSSKEPYKYQIIKINEKEMPIAASGRIVYDEEKRMLLKIHIIFLEEVSDKVFKIYFEDNSIRFTASETPDLFVFMNKFMDDDLLLKIKKYKKLGSMDYLVYKGRKILHPKVLGYIDD